MSWLWFAEACLKYESEALVHALACSVYMYQVMEYEACQLYVKNKQICSMILYVGSTRCVGCEK